jgi:hypothetical protein
MWSRGICRTSNLESCKCPTSASLPDDYRSPFRTLSLRKTRATGRAAEAFTL